MHSYCGILWSYVLSNAELFHQPWRFSIYLGSSYGHKCKIHSAQWPITFNIQGSVLITLIFLSVMFIVMVALRFMTIWPLIQREISDSIYTFSAFYIAESLVTQIFATVLPLCYAVITYPLFGLRMEWISLFNYCWILIACASLCLSIGYLVRLVWASTIRQTI